MDLGTDFIFEFYFLPPLPTYDCFSVRWWFYASNFIGGDHRLFGDRRGCLSAHGGQICISKVKWRIEAITWDN